MDMKKSKTLLVYLSIAYWALSMMIYFIAGDQFRCTHVTSNALSASATVGELTDGVVIDQAVTVPANELHSLSLLTATYGRTNQGTLLLTFRDTQGNHLASQTANISSFADNEYTTIKLDNPIVGYKGQTVQLSIETQGCAPGNALTIFAGNAVNAGRFDIGQDIADSERYHINGTPGIGKLCIELRGVDQLGFYRFYWVIVGGLFAIAALICLYWWRMAKQNKNNPLVIVCTMFTRYQFLLKQLISRDFKVKYKRSILGMAWSFLNPLLTMSVQYVVFSTLFKSDIPNYSVYLLTGIVFMNYFTEAVSMGITSITSNAALIKKVYMPKYIYPLSRVISSLVNFLIALIPLMLVMLFNGLWPRPALLLLVFDILCMLCFVTGMVFLLSTAMTFFQDTQFLWSVASMMWMYLTPVFYPESIIPVNLRTLYHMNPMYQYITFARTCIIDGVSPQPMAFCACLVSAMLVLLLGSWVFKKNQDKFVLYL